MKKSLVLLVMCASSLLLGGCDFIRVVAGRPDSDYIEAKRALIARQQLLGKIATDTVAVQETVDSALVQAPSEPASSQTAPAQVAPVVQSEEARELENSLQQQKKLITTDVVKNVKKDNLYSRYYIIIGSFSQSQNALNLVQKVKAEGFDALVLPYYNGLNAVAVHPCDDLVEADNALQDVKKHSFCPADAWILEVKR